MQLVPIRWKLCRAADEITNIDVLTVIPKSIVCNSRNVRQILAVSVTLVWIKRLFNSSDQLLLIVCFNVHVSANLFFRVSPVSRLGRVKQPRSFLRKTWWFFHEEQSGLFRPETMFSLKRICVPCRAFSSKKREALFDFNV